MALPEIEINCLGSIANAVELKIDGKVVEGVSAITVEIRAMEMTRVTVEYFVSAVKINSLVADNERVPVKRSADVEIIKTIGRVE
jgi:hypothetical protein